MSIPCLGVISERKGGREKRKKKKKEIENVVEQSGRNHVPMKTYVDNVVRRKKEKDADRGEFAVVIHISSSHPGFIGILVVSNEQPVYLTIPSMSSQVS